MSRSNYSDEHDSRELALWRGYVASALRGKRGQKMLRDLLEGLDAMPEKRLIAGEFISSDGEVCALGACAVRRGVEGIEKFDPEEHEPIAAALDVAICLVREVEYENDEGGPWNRIETPEERFVRMRKWVVKNLREESI